MSTEPRKLGKEIFDRFVSFFEKNNFNVTTSDDEEGFDIMLSGRGDDLPMDMLFQIDVTRQLIMVLSQMPYNFSKDMLLDGAVATSMINHAMADGSFDYDVQTGAVIFRMTTCWAGGLIADEVFDYMFGLTIAMVDKYNDKLLMVAKGAMSLDDLYKFIHS